MEIIITILPDGTVKNLPQLTALQKLAVLMGVPAEKAAQEAANRVVRDTTGKPA